MEEAKSKKEEKEVAVKNFCSDSDTLELEDNSGRITLSGSCLPVDQLVSGIAIGIKGSIDETGAFQVDEVCYPDLPPQSPANMATSDDDVRYAVLISDLQIGDAGVNQLRIQLLFDFLSSLAGGSFEREMNSNIVRIIIAGNSLCPVEKMEPDSSREGLSKVRRYFTHSFEWVALNPLLTL